MLIWLVVRLVSCLLGGLPGWSWLVGLGVAPTGCVITSHPGSKRGKLKKRGDHLKRSSQKRCFLRKKIISS